MGGGWSSQQGSQLNRGQHSGRGPKGYQRSDERIKEDICERLTQAGDLDASDIEVQVNNGEVTLTGTVEQRQWKRIAEDTIENISGVKEVHNQLRVGQGSQEQSGQGSTLSQTGSQSGSQGQSAQGRNGGQGQTSLGTSGGGQSGQSTTSQSGGDRSGDRGKSK
jgi:hypothetical protein